MLVLYRWFFYIIEWVNLINTSFLNSFSTVCLFYIVWTNLIKLISNSEINACIFFILYSLNSNLIHALNFKGWLLMIRQKGINLNHDFYVVVDKQCRTEMRTRVTNTISLYKLTKILLLFIYFKIFMKLMKFYLFYNLFSFFKKIFLIC